MNNYNIFLLLPIFKNLKFLQNEIFNQENLVQMINQAFATLDVEESLTQIAFIFPRINANEGS